MRTDYSGVGFKDDGRLKLLIVVGTRPEIIRLSAVIKKCDLYFDQILGRVKENLAPGVQVIGTYMCQGKMPQVVRDRYEAMEDSPRRAMILANFDQAASHPDAADLARLKAAAAETI